ncbi:MAG: helix-turn-helix transcriptional regulator [Methylotenera sp.]|nr:helix-turn-helix transcriptional regulator [Methylotenera sp.]
MKNFGSRLKEERERLGLNQTSFGQIAGVGRKSQFNYEDDARVPDAEYLAAVAAFGVDVIYLLLGKRFENTATTPTELSYLRICRALPDNTAKMAGNAALLGVMASYGVKLNDNYSPAANDQHHAKVAEPEAEFKEED